RPPDRAETSGADAATRPRTRPDEVRRPRLRARARAPAPAARVARERIEDEAAAVEEDPSVRRGLDDDARSRARGEVRSGHRPREPCHEDDRGEEMPAHAVHAGTVSRSSPSLQSA